MTIKARLEALEARRRAGDGPARAFDALEHMHAPHLARDPVMASQLRQFRIHTAIDFHATASAVVADLAGAGIAYDLAEAEALLVAARARAAANLARLHATPPAQPA